MNRNKTISIVVFILFLATLVFGQAKVGTSSAQFLEIPVGARSVGMADAYIATANDISAIYYNPSGLTQLTRKEIMFTHTMWPAGINHEFAAFAMPVPQLGGVVGVSAIALTTGEMVERTPGRPEGTGRTFTAADLAAGVTYSRKMTDRFSVGLTWKYIGEYYADVKAHSWAMDVGTLYRTGFKSLRVGMGFCNFGPDIKFLQTPYPLPMTFRFGMAGEIVDMENHKVTLAWEGSHPNDNLEKFQVGAEYWYNDMFAVRSGYKFGAWDAESFSAGAGAKIPVGVYNIKVDYAYSNLQALKNVHRFSLGFEF